MDISLIFAFLAIFGVIVYVLADGFDLAVGILFLFAPREVDRDLMMASIEPVWDGNETWLVFGGTFLFAAFPAAYYILLPAFYLPIIFMLFALIFRGIAFSFRSQAGRSRRIWDFAFAGGSIAAAFAQGLVLGGFIGGVDVQNGIFHGSPFSFLSILGILCGLGLIGGYALMGAGWLIWKTDGQTQVFAREIGHAAIILTAAMLAVVSAWTALSEPQVASRWFSWPNIAWLAPIPLISVAALLAAWRALWSGSDGLEALTQDDIVSYEISKSARTGKLEASDVRIEAAK
jgi:cytochrome d ubiquinol oxidase subunit II